MTVENLELLEILRIPSVKRPFFVMTPFFYVPEVKVPCCLGYRRDGALALTRFSPASLRLEGRRALCLLLPMSLLRFAIWIIRPAGSGVVHFFSGPHLVLLFIQLVRSEKLQNESFLNFLNFRPEFCYEFSPILGEKKLRFVSWETETRKTFTKNPHHSSMQNSQANSKKKSKKVFWRAGKVTIGWTILGSSRGPSYQRDLPMQGMFCCLVVC